MQHGSESKHRRIRALGVGGEPLTRLAIFTRSHFCTSPRLALFSGWCFGTDLNDSAVDATGSLKGCPSMPVCRVTGRLQTRVAATGQ